MSKPLSEGEWVLIRFEEKRFLKRLDPKGSVNVGKKVLKFKDIIGKEEGISINGFEIFRPTLEEIILLGFKRKTQIVYPKDSLFVIGKIGVDPSKRVLEVGTGSGAMCAVLSTYAKEVVSVEAREEFIKLAKENLKRFSLGENVSFVHGNFQDLQIEGPFDCAFVDLKDPIPVLEKLYSLLKNGAPAGFLLPTANQVINMLKAIEGLFGGAEVVEILQRHYKTVSDRFRPEDTMSAHTAYLLFVRKLKS